MRVNVAGCHSRFVALTEQRIIQQKRQILRGKVEWDFLVLPRQLTLLNLNARDRKRDQLLDRPLVGGIPCGWHWEIRRAIRIVDHVNNRMLEHQRMQANGCAEQRDDFHLGLEAFHLKKGLLTGSFAAMNREVASIHAQAERDGMQFAEFDPATSSRFQFRDYPVPHPLLKRIGSDVPAEQPEPQHAEQTKSQEQFSQNAAARRRRRRLVQRFPSSGPGSGLRILLPERRLASHPESSSFIFFSASKALIRLYISVSGLAFSPAF